MKTFSEKITRFFKKGAKKTRKNTKKLSKQLYGKKGLSMRHTYAEEISFFGNGKEGKPYLTLSKSGSYRISVFKLAVIILCLLSSAVLLALVIKAIADHAKSKKDEYDIYDYVDEDELPF